MEQITEHRIRRIMCCCGNGLGTSLFMQMTMEEALEKLDVSGVEVCFGSLADAMEGQADLFVVSEELLEEEESDKAYVITPTERTKIIVCQIVISGKPTAVEDLIQPCQVSRNTIFTDLQAVISQLYTYQLEPLLSAGHLNFLHVVVTGLVYAVIAKGKPAEATVNEMEEEEEPDLDDLEIEVF